MKKALLLCFGLLVLLAADLKAAPANVNFASERGIPFQLVFDGRALTRNVAREVHIDRLVPGYHWAEFFIPTGYGRSVSYRTRVFLDPGLETTYVLVTRQGYPPVLRKVGAFPLRGGPRGGYGPQGGYDPRYDDRGGRNDGYYDDSYGSNGAGANGGGYNGSAGGNGGYDNYPPNGGQYSGGSVSVYRPLQDQDVDALVNSVRSKSFDSSRLNVAKQALEQSAIQADDLKRLLGTLDFENSKVELAKFAYPHVTDQQNFYRVYDSFQYESSIKEVQDAAKR
ncbi:DUF4476 domain-containing protein [Hymenobacter chitinivorans]|uniref:Uncharacterized protein DUF4476 n=1 Tax=Hymenobacter chitinivorans DSM 11115 TaxID=1121954 RepID=A0A2M9ARU0_9BACT|nr:DUF4476 domain-containing protein [Hymenobacter chitinivorans]PJJ48399.1 uncharacterized protein DUF4476 [Hymenobacter chitinivorans DSM 11115]